MSEYQYYELLALGGFRAMLWSIPGGAWPRPALMQRLEKAKTPLSE